MKLHAFMTTPELAGHEFLGDSWATWRIVARLVDGDPHLLSDAEMATALQLTGRMTLASQAPDEIFIGAGRRSGKSRFTALVGCWLAAGDYSDKLAAGETATIALVAPDRRQAALLLGYVRGIVTGSDILNAELVNESAEVLSFRHGTKIEIATASYKTIRGSSLAGCALEESAYLRSQDSALPDIELYRAVLPALLTLGGKLICISSPHRKVGLLHDAFKRLYGNDSATRGIYIQATSRQLNPLLNEEAIERAMEADPTAAASEYLGLFRTDIQSYLDDALVDQAIVPNRRMLPRMHDIEYVAFADPSGGRSDSFTLAIGHQESGRVILDTVRSFVPPFQPSDVVRQCAETLSAYGLATVTGDNCSGQWCADGFRTCGVAYLTSELSKSQIYLEALVLFTSGLVELLDSPQLHTQLLLLERRPRSGSRDTVDHPRGAHDDIANSVCGALRLASKLDRHGRSANASVIPHRHVSGLSYDPYERHAREMARLQ